MAKSKPEASAEPVKLGDGFADVTLSRPLDVDGNKVGTLRMREPTVADMEISQKGTGGDAAKEIAMFANLCEVAPDDLRKLPLRDWLRMQAAFALFTD